MLDLQYIISAPGMLGVFTNPRTEARKELLKQSFLSCTNTLKEIISERTKNTRSSVNVLYNAYTEARLANELQYFDNFGLKNVYADSGGLQIVTAGKVITEELKQKVYEAQTYSDYAMCFDVIPLSSISDTRTRNERSNVRNKIFHQDKHAEAGKATGINIKTQIEHFKKSGAKTKVIIIVQGNTADDMDLYFRQIASCLNPDDYDYIGGMAVADTCMGNGEAESIEMLIGARKIASYCHDNVKNHLHILGVGSISRMRPIIYLIDSGYLSFFKTVSYDSSSHTSCFDYGLLKMNGTCTALGSTGTKKAIDHFSKVYDMFFEGLSPLGTKNDFLDILFGDRSVDWKYSSVKERGFATEKDEKVVLAILTKSVHCLYMIENFVYNIDNILNTHSSLGIENLRKVKDDYTMSLWQQYNLGTRKIKSKRINRNENFTSLEGFFDNE